MRRWLLLGVVGLLIVGAVIVLRGLQGTGPLGARLGSTVTSVRPIGYALPPSTEDPRTLVVLFPWDEATYCNGQFTVRAVESDTRVEIADVVSRQLRGTVSCLGLVARDGKAAAAARLDMPVGDRQVIRARDGQPLAKVNWPAAMLGGSAQ
jgi:hypothetical protein